MPVWQWNKKIQSDYWNDSVPTVDANKNCLTHSAFSEDGFQISLYTVKKVRDFPVPNRDVTYQTLLLAGNN